MLFDDSFESYFGALALAADIRERKADLIVQRVGNTRLCETWGLQELLHANGEKDRFTRLLEEQRERTSVSAG
jgi:hypothetical protein